MAVGESAPGGGSGSVGIAIDESDYGAFLFITFEDTDDIEIVNAKSMQYVDIVTAPGATNLAGIAMDEGNRYSKSSINRAKAALGFTPQAFDQAINSVISTRLLATSQL